MAPFHLTAVATVLLAIGHSATVWGVEIAPLRHTVGTSANAYIPYAASHSLAKPNQEITRILFSIHSSGFDALQYYDNARAAVLKRGLASETLIVAPQLFVKTAIPGRVPVGMLFWRVSPYRGSARAAIGPEAKNLSISAFAVIDQWLSELTKPELFPRLKDIVLVGHSGGGQFVQRYAMVGKFKAAAQIKMRYVVSAPSSYAYPSRERFHQKKKRFVVPDGQALAQCPGYNSWGYGLEQPYVYFANVSAEKIAKEYGRKSVFYLCGSKDSNPNDNTIGKNCGAMMQGLHRLQRMKVFEDFLKFKYGKMISQKHIFAVVPNMGHYGRGTMNSTQGLNALFNRIP